MSDDLYEVWRDDRLIEAAARGDLLALEDDPAAGPLVALSMLADGGSLPTLDVNEAALVDSHTSHRYAVRSLAIAVTAVATLSTSGVAAVVTGDPFRPAKAVWHQIQDHTGLRSDSDGAEADSGAALGAPAVEPQRVGAARPSQVSISPGASPAEGLTAQAPVRASEAEAGNRAVTTEGSQASTAEDPATQEGAQRYSEGDTQPSDEQDQSQQPAEPTGPEQQEPSDDSGSQPAPDDQQAPGDDSDDDGLEDLVPPGSPDDGQDDGTQPDDGSADDDQVLDESSSQPPSAIEDGLQDGLQDEVQNTVPGTVDGSSDTGTTSPPPTVAP